MTDSRSRLHMALTTSNLDRSADFYQRFLDLEPVVRTAAFAKFRLEDPPLTLSLNRGEATQNGRLNHLGLQLGSAEALLRAAARLKDAGIELTVEKDTECCFSIQDKFWVADPDGVPWEIYVVKADTQRGAEPRQSATL